MPIKFVKHYTPQDCQDHPNWLYVFGDNFQRKGKAGQAVIRDEPNAVGIVTKQAPSMKNHAFLADEDFSFWAEQNMVAFNRIEDHLASKGIVVLPSHGLGTGLAQLDKRAPLIWNELRSWVHMWVEKYGSR